MGLLAILSIITGLISSVLSCYYAFQGNWEMMAGFLILAHMFGLSNK